MTINNPTAGEREALVDVIHPFLGAEYECVSEEAMHDQAHRLAGKVLAANFHRTPSPSVVTTVEQCDDWEPNGGPQCAREMGHDGLHSMSKPTSPPPSEVRVTGEQVEAAARAIYEASAYGDSEDMARAAFAAAGIPVAGEES